MSVDHVCRFVAVLGIISFCFALLMGCMASEGRISRAAPWVLVIIAALCALTVAAIAP